jgi:hypothetical protein
LERRTSSTLADVRLADDGHGAIAVQVVEEGGEPGLTADQHIPIVRRDQAARPRVRYIGANRPVNHRAALPSVAGMTDPALLGSTLEALDTFVDGLQRGGAHGSGLVEPPRDATRLVIGEGRGAAEWLIGSARSVASCTCVCSSSAISTEIG